MSVLTYSPTPASNANALASGGSLADGACTIPSLNDKVRQILADIAMLYADTSTGITTTGTAPAYAVTTASSHSTYATNVVFRARMHADCPAGAATMNVNALGVKDLKIMATTGLRNPLAGELKQDMAYDMVYVPALNCFIATGAALDVSSLVTPTVAPAFVAGTNAQGQAPLLSDNNIIATAAANPSGVTLPVAVTGKSVSIRNNGANSVNVYPATGATITGNAVNVPVSLPVGALVTYTARSATQWDANLAAESLLTTAGDTLVRGATAAQRLPVGADRQAITVVSGAPAYASAFESSAQITLNAINNDMLGIPSWANEVDVLIDGASGGGPQFLIRGIVSGAAVATGYFSYSASIDNGAVGQISDTTSLRLTLLTI